MCFPVGSGRPHVLSQDISLSDLWYYWLGQGLRALNGWARMGSVFREFIQAHSLLFPFAKWAPLMEEIFSSQVAVLAQTGAWAYLKGILLLLLPPSSLLL